MILAALSIPKFTIPLPLLLNLLAPLGLGAEFVIKVDRLSPRAAVFSGSIAKAAEEIDLDAEVLFR